MSNILQFPSAPIRLRTEKFDQAKVGDLARFEAIVAAFDDDGKIIGLGECLRRELIATEEAAAQAETPDYDAIDVAKTMIGFEPTTVRGFAYYVLALAYSETRLGGGLSMEMARLLEAAARVGEFNLPAGLAQEAKDEIDRVTALRADDDDAGLPS